MKKQVYYIINDLCRLYFSNEKHYNIAMFTPTESECIFQEELEQSFNKLQFRSYTTVADVSNLIEREKRRYAKDVLTGSVTLPKLDKLSSSGSHMGLIDGVPHIEYDAAMEYPDDVRCLHFLGRFFKLLPACVTTLAVYNNRLLMKSRFNLEKWPALVVTELWKDLYNGLIVSDDILSVKAASDVHKRELLAQGKFLLRYFYPNLTQDVVLFAATELNMVTSSLDSFAETFNLVNKRAALKVSLNTQVPTAPLPDADYTS